MQIRKSKWCITGPRITRNKKKEMKLKATRRKETSKRKMSRLCQYLSTRARAKGRERVRYSTARAMDYSRRKTIE